jgi:dipeptidyl aminopeptidase/acylaminoacyl peptidase
MDKLPFKILVFVAILTTALAAIFVAANSKVRTPDLPTFASTFATPTPSPSASVTTTTIEAPDGKMTLTVQDNEVEGGLKKTFSTQGAGGALTEIYSETVPGGNTLSVPYNTFSPDDRYLFLKETTPTQTYYYVLTTSGKPITSNSATLEVSGLFYAKYSDFIITDVTGWGGLNLLVVNTNNKSGGQGPSFWFEVPSGGFIRLSTRFN